MYQELCKIHTCCFFGHRKINETKHLNDIVYKNVESLIVDNGVNVFLFGSKSQFDDLCHKVVANLKQKYPHIKRIYVRAKFPYIDDNYKRYLLLNHEDTYYPNRIINSGKAAYVERNYKMIDKSNFCVVYYDENYMPPKRKHSKKDLIDYQPKSGTKLAYDYAKRKGLILNNVALCCIDK